MSKECLNDESGDESAGAADCGAGFQPATEGRLDACTTFLDARLSSFGHSFVLRH
jgi:hypothetical protein